MVAIAKIADADGISKRLQKHLHQDSQPLMKVLIDGMPQHLAKPREPRVMRCGGCGCESEHQ